MRSLRSQLLVGTAVGATIVLVASSVVLYALISRTLWSDFDASLTSKARSLAALAEQDGDKLELEFDEAHLPEFEPSDHAEYYQVWLPGGEVITRSRSLQNQGLELIRGTSNAPAYRTVRLPDGRPGRAVGITFAPRQDDEDLRPNQPLEVTLVVGRETAGIESTLTRLGLLLSAVCLVAVLASLGVLAWCVRRGLRPVGQLSTQIANVGENDLTARIDAGGVPIELLPVVDRLNDLLARLEGAFQRERRFTADVAHELRTPLAGVRSTLEVALSKQRDARVYQEVMSECLAINQQMQQMVENLLNLARADARQLEIEREAVDLPQLIRECWKPLEAQAGERGLCVEWQLQEPCTLDTDPGKLRLVLQNTLHNAVTYANGGGHIRIESYSSDGQTGLRVANTGSELTEDQLGRVFDRFWRGDSSRAATEGRCGLGLALCRQLMTLLDGSISVSSTASGVFTVSITFNNR